MSLQTTFSNFCSDPDNDEYIKALSLELGLLTQNVYQSIYEKKLRKKMSLKDLDYEVETGEHDPDVEDDVIEIGSDDYKPLLKFMLIDTLGNDLIISDKNTKRLVAKILDDEHSILNSMMKTITSKEFNDKPREARIPFNNQFTGWAALQGILEETKELKPVINSHIKFKKNLDRVKEQANTYSATNPKRNHIRQFASTASNNMNDYLESLYWNYKDPSQINTLQDKANQLTSEIQSKTKLSIEALDEHRTSRTARALTALCVGFTAVITAGITLIGKLIYSKITTGKATAFIDHTRSGGKVRNALEAAASLGKSVSKLPKASKVA